MAHSKRNTSRPIFTSHERAMARAAWGTSTARLTRDSFLPFASCWLCLEPAVDPVACAVRGDLFCRECALSNILAQKKEIKRADRAREAEAREAREDGERRDAEARERAVREFELTQAGLSINRGGADAGAARGKERTEPGRDHDRERSGSRNGDGAVGDTPKVGDKRKFSLDPDEVARIAEEERSKARRAIDDEKSSKPTLPSFWAPTVTPSSNTSNTLHEVKKKTKTQPVCPASAEDSPHHYSLHTLITVNFSEEQQPDSSSSATKKSQRICPACQKGLTNSSRATLAKPCGHVLCKSCVDQFMRSSAGGETIRCYVCEADLTANAKESGKKDKIQPGLVELRREGTGFSAGGSNQVKKEAVMFRC
ncbi:hypothetical protein B0J18DRAFT_465807 [Chaetomium sp. MPI-SDFR-AT-0129]|nr:hypothetical protein B0J18DRAFT_465807 [Chaetomium sp. MPI-SDFR-AT-0129]